MDLWLEIVLTVQNRNGCLTTHTFSGTTYGVVMGWIWSTFVQCSVHIEELKFNGRMNLTEQSRSSPIALPTCI